MSKLAKIRLELSQILASFSELKTDKAILYWPTDEEIREGLEVYVLDENGDYDVAPDGEYIDEAENTIVVKDGKVESVTPKAEEPVDEPSEEPVAEEVPIAAEETPAEEVESPSGEEEPVPDAIEEVRKEVNELYEIVDKLIKKVAELDSRLGESNERLEKMSKMSAASPAEEEIETAESTAKTNNKKFESALEGIKAARNLKTIN
ncbi:MAG: hypothetical protein J6S85_03250 [Methanobrevibacter sp.]|nr:hypothetical protein [Methanobrevibacter sp.]